MNVTLLHPSWRTLQGYLDDTQPDARRAWVAAHLAQCTRCRTRVAELRALREGLRGLPTPEPSEGILARIQASRASGARVILPAPASPSRLRRAPLKWVVAAVAAVAAVILLWPKTRGEGESSFDLFGGTLLLPAGLQAQQISDTAARARYPLLGAVDGTRIRSGQWTYDGRLIEDGFVDSTSQGLRVVSVAQAEQNGRPVWIVTTSTTGRYTRGAMGDSLFLEQSTLRLMRRVMYYTGGHANSRDYPDSARYAISWQWADVGWHGTLYRLLFQLTPLTRKWRGSVYLALPVDRDRWKVFPLDQQVVGEEVVRVPAGTFDCWKVLTKLRRTEATIWIEKRGQWVVKVQQRGGEDAVWEQVLSAYTSSPTPH